MRTATHVLGSVLNSSRHYHWLLTPNITFWTETIWWACRLTVFSVVCWPQHVLLLTSLWFIWTHSTCWYSFLTEQRNLFFLSLILSLLLALILKENEKASDYAKPTDIFELYPNGKRQLSGFDLKKIFKDQKKFNFKFSYAKEKRDPLNYSLLNVHRYTTSKLCRIPKFVESKEKSYFQISLILKVQISSVPVWKRWSRIRMM